MAEYKQVDLQIGTEAQFESKKETLPIGTIVGITDPVHKSELDSDLQTSIDSIANKLDKPSGNPTDDSLVKVSSAGSTSYQSLATLVDTDTGGQIITGAKVFVDCPVVCRNVATTEVTKFNPESMTHTSGNKTATLLFPTVGGYFSIAPTVAPTEPSVIVAGTDRAPVWKPLGEFGNSNLSLLDVYPIGSIYLSVNSTSPATLFGGTWEQIKDRFLLAAGDTYSAGLTGGEATHTLTEAEMPNHQHGVVTDMDGYGGASPTGNYIKMKGNEVVNGYTTETGVAYNGWKGMSGAGDNQAHNNMPPYLTVYMWKRVS